MTRSTPSSRPGIRMVELLAALIVIVITIAGVRRFGPLRTSGRDPRPDPEIGTRVLVAVAAPTSGRALGEFAAALARHEHARFDVLTVVPPANAEEIRPLARETLDCCAAAAAESGLTVRRRLRVDTSVGTGIVHQSVESDATLLVLGWPEVTDDTVATPVTAAIERVPCPVLVTRLQGYRWTRIVLQVPVEPIDAGARASLSLATEIAERVGQAHDVPVVCVRDPDRAHDTGDELLVLPVPPEEGELDRAVRRSAPLGDVALALSHGPRAAHERELLSTAAGLYRTNSPG